MTAPLVRRPDYLRDPIATICAPLSAECPPQWSRTIAFGMGIKPNASASARRSAATRSAAMLWRNKKRAGR